MEEDILKRIIKDYSKGNSIRKLRDKYNYSVGNLHYHLKRNNVLRKNNIIQTVNNNDPFLIGLFIGIFAGDGSKFIDRLRYTVQIHINKKDVELVALIRGLLNDLFDKKISVY